VHNGACACAVAVKTTVQVVVPVVSMSFPDSFNAVSGHFETVRTNLNHPKLYGQFQNVRTVSKCLETALKLNPNSSNMSTITRDV
jgi:hypothetical protein